MRRMDTEQARFNMIEQQIRPWAVVDPIVLDLLGRVHREDFVPPEFRELAFADIGIPLGFGEEMMAPKIEARLLQELAPTPESDVLEIGTGSGYMTALLASRARRVESVEIREEFSRKAAEKLHQKSFSNVETVVGDGARGWNPGATYDAIILTGSLPLLPNAYKTALNDSGRLVAIVGEEPVMEAVLITRHGGEWEERSLFDTSLPALVNAETPSPFVF
jgi:protein-L-isoaspartate(D-aspartate) O-methyltransferase